MKPGTYMLVGRVIVQRRTVDLDLEQLSLLSLGLFTEAPSPEGTNGMELSVPGYARQPAAFGPLSMYGRIARNCTAVTFVGVETWPQPTHAAAFDADGAMLAYGPLLKSAGVADADQAVFAATGIGLRFS